MGYTDKDLTSRKDEKFIYKNRLKALVTLLISVAAVSMGGCGVMKEKPEFLKGLSEQQAEHAEQMLYEKYGEEFVVESVGGRWGTATDGTYSCIVHPADNEKLKFVATVDKEYNFMQDDYAMIFAERMAADYLFENYLSQLDDTASVYASTTSGVNSSNLHMSFDEYLEGKYYFYTVIFVNESVDFNQVIEKYMEALQDYDNLNITLIIYPASDDVKSRFEEWKKTHYDEDDEFKAIVSGLEKIIYYRGSNGDITIERETPSGEIETLKNTQDE